MSIIRAGKISINGSQTAFGGYVYSAQFSHNYGGNPSTLSMGIISKSREYLPVKLSAVVPYNIQIGDELTLKMYAVETRISDGVDGRVLTIDFEDGRIKMNRIWIALSDFPCKSPNIIKIGSKFVPINPTSDNPQAPPPPLGALSVGGLTEPTKPQDGIETYFSYDYSQLQKASPIPLPNITNATPVIRLNNEGSLADVFSEFCRIYGFTWYWNHETESPTLLDLRTDVDIDLTLSDKLTALPCFKSIVFGESIKDLSAQGGIFYGNFDNKGTDTNQNWGAVKVNNVFDNVDFFGEPIYNKNDLEAAVFATFGEQVYERYLLDKYGADENNQEKFDTLFKILGYQIFEGEDSDGSKIPPVRGYNELKDAQKSVIDSRFRNDGELIHANLKVIRARRNTTEISQKTAHFLMADLIKKGEIGWFESPFELSSANNVQISKVTSDQPLGQVPSISSFLVPKTSQNIPQDNIDHLANFNTFDSPKAIRDVTTNFLYVVRFPALKINLNLANVAKDANGNDIITNNVFSLEQRFVRVADNSLNDIDAKTNDEYFLVWGQKRPVPSFSFNGKIGYAGLETPTVGGGSAGTSNLIDSYSSKYKNSVCDIPTLNDLVTSFRITSISNESSIIPILALKNLKILPTKTAKTLSVDVYGINTGLGLTPEMGLDSFRIIMSSEGYETNYTLSSKKRIPLDNRNFQYSISSKQLHI